LGGVGDGPDDDGDKGVGVDGERGGLTYSGRIAGIGEEALARAFSAA
jgi:hypothetical protein